MTRGALIFAFNNEQTDYLEMAAWSAENIRRHLNIPVAVVTDRPDADSDRRFDQVLNDIIKKSMGGTEGTPLLPIGDFAQGMLFELYNRANLLDKSGIDENVDEHEDD